MEEDAYNCVYDSRNGQGGDCYSGEKVKMANRPCSWCLVGSFPVQYAIFFDLHYQPFPHVIADQIIEHGKNITPTLGLTILLTPLGMRWK